MSTQGQQGNKDMVDKGLEGAEKKFGGSMGQNTEKNRGVNEKIVREMSKFG
jgi:hypothetical protein